eukprot:jgi/Botrbrau1/22637/Bobra.176_1s0062.2
MESLAGETLDKIFDLEDIRLGRVLTALGLAVSDISDFLRVAETTKTASTNPFGDQQLKVDIKCDKCVFDRLLECGEVGIASSEEQPLEVGLTTGATYSVAFDPLDGSSIVDANFSVGSIFGVWGAGPLVGRTGHDLVAAAYAVYGPRTTLVVACTQVGQAGAGVTEVVLTDGGKWLVRRRNIRIGEKKIFAPANLRAAADNEAYRQLVQDVYIAQQYTLRYTGGLVPDVHHILTKGGGVFCNPASPNAPPKLRLLYEVLPLAFVVEAAGGKSHASDGSALDIRITSTDLRSIVSLGSPAEVAKTIFALQNRLPGEPPSVPLPSPLPYGVG